MRLPSAFHPITVTRFEGRVTARLDGLTMGQSGRALAKFRTLKERALGALPEREPAQEPPVAGTAGAGAG